MRSLTILLVTAVLGWFGWWYYASQTARDGAETALAQARSAGWQIDYDALSVQGFPNRIDLTITNPNAVDPKGHFEWSSDFFQTFSLSYKPWHIVSVFAPQQNLRFGRQEVQLNTQDLRASLVLRPSVDLPLDRFQLAGQDLTLRGPETLTLQSLSLATRPTIDRANSHDLGATLTDLRLPHSVMQRLPDSLMGDLVQRLHLDAAITFDRPIDRHVAQEPAQMTALFLREAVLEWDEVQLRLSGELAPDAAGLIGGHVNLHLDNKAKALTVLKALLQLPPLYEQVLDQMVVGLAPGEAPLDIKFQLRDGQMFLGPMPLGQVPAWPQF